MFAFIINVKEGPNDNYKKDKKNCVGVTQNIWYIPLQC